MMGFDLLLAGACMGGSVSSFAISNEGHGAASYWHGIITLVVGTLAAMFCQTCLSGTTAFSPMLPLAVAVILVSLALTTLRFGFLKRYVLASYFALLTGLVAWPAASLLPGDDGSHTAAFTLASQTPSPSILGDLP